MFQTLIYVRTYVTLFYETPYLIGNCRDACTDRTILIMFDETSPRAIIMNANSFPLQNEYFNNFYIDMVV